LEKGIRFEERLRSHRLCGKPWFHINGLIATQDVTYSLVPLPISFSQAINDLGVSRRKLLQNMANISRGFVSD